MPTVPAALADPPVPDRRRSLPPGARGGTVAMDDGWPLRVATWAAKPGAPGSILFLGGRGDFIEKYSEALWTWRDWGAGLMAFDWRGQGRSGRLGSDPMRGHAASFDRWVDDLDFVVARFAAELPGPHVAVAHSMGGHLLLRHLARGGGPIERAALLAPFLGLRSGIPAAALARLATLLGFGGAYGPMQRPYGDWQQRPERRALLTSDPVRFADEHRWIAQEPALALGGVTWGWVDAAARSMRALRQPGVLEGIATPILALSGDWERLVDPDAARRAMARLPNGQFVVIPSGAHELLRERPEIQADVHARIRTFLFRDATA